MIVVRRALAAACLALVVVIAVQQAHDAIATPGRGLDFGPLRDAALALVHGASIYTNPRFVYPPTAAVALLPLSIGSAGAEVDAWIVACTVAVALSGLLSIAPWRRGEWWLVAVLAAGLMVKSDALTDSLWIANVSLLLAPVAVGVLLLYEAGHWRAGSALLVVSLLIKPLLIPLILLPLLRGQWRAILGAALGGCVLLAAAILLVPGGGHFFSVLRFLENGGTLTRGAAVYNVSIRGLAQRLDEATWGSVARLAVLAATAALAFRWARRPPVRGSPAHSRRTTTCSSRRPACSAHSRCGTDSPPCSSRSRESCCSRSPSATSATSRHPRRTCRFASSSPSCSSPPRRRS